MLIMNLVGPYTPPAMPVDAVFFTFLLPFIIFVLGKRLVAPKKQWNTKTAAATLMASGTILGSLLWAVG